MSAAMEILAPAGDAQSLKAAAYSGADAVYLGLKQFSARRTAGNFTPEELRWAVGFCHARGMKVYVAVNTTAHSGEVEALAESIRCVAQAGADAMIVQDLAVAALARQMAPQLPLHGSTQMSVHTLAGALQLLRLGFSRVVLARELTLQEVRHITANCPIEVEVFVHGALCMSVSGQCYMSVFLGGRSGNRGGCAGPCRLPFAADGSGACHLSLKDLSAVESLPQLAQAGVVSAKIEGRLRGPEYVAGAVDACRRSLAGQTYDAAYAIFYAMEAGESADRASIVEQLPNTDFEGVTGKITFDEEGNCPKQQVLLEIHNGEYVEVPGALLNQTDYEAKLGV